MTATQATRSRRSFRLLRVLWMAVWLLLLVVMFSGLQFMFGPLHLRTLTLDWRFIRDWWLFISRGVVITLELAVLSIILASLAAFSSALARISKVPSLNSLAGLYISLIRGTSLFLQFLFIYQALPQLGLVLNSFSSAILALGLNYGAYMSEIFRAGIQTISRGQTEAASALGMTRKRCAS